MTYNQLFKLYEQEQKKVKEGIRNAIGSGEADINEYLIDKGYYRNQCYFLLCRSPSILFFEWNYLQ